VHCTASATGSASGTALAVQCTASAVAAVQCCTAGLLHCLPRAATTAACANAVPKIKKISYVTIVVVLINFLLKSLNILMAQKASTSTAKN